MFDYVSCSPNVSCTLAWIESDTCAFSCLPFNGRWPCLSPSQRSACLYPCISAPDWRTVGRIRDWGQDLGHTWDKFCIKLGLVTELASRASEFVALVSTCLPTSVQRMLTNVCLLEEVGSPQAQSRYGTVAMKMPW